MGVILAKFRVRNGGYCIVFTSASNFGTFGERNINIRIAGAAGLLVYSDKNL